MPKKKINPAAQSAESYRHDENEALLRPDAGLQAQFKKKKPPKTYRYDSSLDPEMSWDINAGRDQAEVLIGKILKTKSLDEAKVAAGQLKAMSSPFLNWAGKAEKSELTVPTLPLFVHERLSTKAILESVKKRRIQMQLFADPELDIADRVLGAYVHKTNWANRLILGDNLQVMNSMLEYEGLGGQVQMIYMDPPYGVKFGSNFQPFIRKRDGNKNGDEDLTREPEMVQAYRDTWELGLHSFLTYLRDRFKLARELLTPSGSIFVQISDENVHHVRELMDEVFGPDNFCSLISFRKTSGFGSILIDTVSDYIIWYAKAKNQVKFRKLYLPKDLPANDPNYRFIRLSNGKSRPMNTEERAEPNKVPQGSRIFRLDNITSEGKSQSEDTFLFDGECYKPGANLHWKTTLEGMETLAKNGRVDKFGRQIAYLRFFNDFPFYHISNNWDDTATGGFGDEKLYVVQTTTKTIERCILMTTDPGDLVLDPTCGSGTTAYAAEKWGRRWITIDTSRVPVALTRQRLLTATYPWFELRDTTAGLSGGFKYERKQNSKAEEIGGIVPHVMLESIAKDEKPKEEVLVDKPNIDSSITRVTGPFVIEATIPTPVDIDEDGSEDSGTDIGDYYERVFLALQQVQSVQQLGSPAVKFKNVKELSNSQRLQAEALTKDNGDKSVAFTFGPPSAAISEKQVFEAAREAYAKSYSHLYVLGFACQDTATRFIKEAKDIVGIPTSYVNVTMDVQMGDLLKNQRSSQIFSITSSPEIQLIRMKQAGDHGEVMCKVELLGLDSYDPVQGEINHMQGNNVPCWLLDTDYDDLSFKVCQAFFPRTSAWDNIKRSLKSQFDESVWDHLAGNISEPFPIDKNEKIAVKVVDDRGNELMVTKLLSEAVPESDK
jgi:adenine-specific DNA-methyltransferase